MKVSVITVCYNSSETIADTIKSVLGQSHPDIEYIIVDGNSADGTQVIIKSFGEKITQFISGKDEGIYFALNKGIALATGEIISLLHADDIYADDQVISDIVKTFEKSGADAVYGDLVYVQRDDLSKTIRFWKSGNYKPGKFLKGWMPPHPSFFVKKKVYDSFGKFNTILKSAADYEFMLRVIHKNGIKLAYLPRVLVKMRAGGKSNVTFANRLRANREDRLAWKLNGLNPGLFTFLLKPVSKISQFFKKQ